MSREPFAGRPALITGGASGIGLGIGRALAARGMKVVLADIDRAGLDRALEQIPGAAAVVLDVGDRAAWTRALDETEARFGPLAVLVCNAGIAGTRLPVAESTEQGWTWTRNVLLDGVFHGLNLGVPRVLASGAPGHVVITSSLGALIPQAGNAIYCGLKAAVLTFAEALRQELAETSVKVSVLLPGLVATRILDGNRERAPTGLFTGGPEPELETALRAGMAPDEVGALVAGATGTDRFWLFTHPELRPMIDARAAEMSAAMD